MSFLHMLNLFHFVFDYLFLLPTCSHWGPILLCHWSFPLHSLTCIYNILLMHLWMNLGLSRCQILSICLKAALDLLKLMRIRRDNPNIASINLLHVILHVFWILVIPFKLRKHFSDIIYYQLRQFLIIIFDYEAEEFAIVIVNNVANLLLKWKRG